MWTAVTPDSVPAWCFDCVPSPALRVCSLAADFVVRQELLEEDMADLLHHLNARKGGWAC